jgi:peroxiredoxin
VTPHHSRHYTLSSGLTLAVDHWGDPGPDGPAGSDEPVLFLHGGGQTRHSWGSTARILAEAGRHAISVDLRGHGESDWAPDGSYELSDYAGDIAELLDLLAVRPVLVGASLGGMTAMMLEGQVRPGSLRALVLVDIVPRMNIDGADRVKSFMSANVDQGFASLDEVADAIAAYNPHRPRPSDLSGLEKNLRRRGDRWYWHWDPKMLEPAAGLETLRTRQVRNGELMAEVLAGVEVPMLLVRGRMSDLVTEEGARQFLAEFPGARFVDVSGAGHMVAGDRNDVFTAAVVDFLSSIDNG